MNSPDISRSGEFFHSGASMDLSFYIQNILLGFGLAMDSFSVSIADTLAEPDMSKRKGLLIAGTFGFCQAAFPLIGWFLVHTLLSVFMFLEKIIPWAALIMLAWIGGNMIKESFGPPEEAKPGFDVKTMFMMAIATSIDALAVGITFVAVPVKVFDSGKMINVLFAVAMIAVITCIISTIH